MPLLCLQTNSSGSKYCSLRSHPRHPHTSPHNSPQNSPHQQSSLERKNSFGFGTNLPSHPGGGGGQRKSIIPGLGPSMGPHPLATDHHSHHSLPSHVGFKHHQHGHHATSNHPLLQHQSSCHAGVTHSLSLGLKSPNNILHCNGGGGNDHLSHKKLDRSLSEPAEKLAMNGNSSSARTTQGNSSRYKTELCRPFEENGSCKYGDKCQFAHGMHELRNLLRHPKYKTELCRTFHTTGFCPYGPRCHFIHNSEETKKTVISSLQAGFHSSQMQQPMPVSASSVSSNQQLLPNPSVRVPRLVSRSMTSEGLLNPSVGITSTTSGLKNSLKPCISSPITNSSSSSVVRPKAMSVGSFSIGSSGDLTPPSSPSGSPTSLGSFFCEEAFNHAFASSGLSTSSPTTGCNGMNSGLMNGVVSSSLSSHPANNPFSFTSTDFNSLFAASSSSSNSSSSKSSSSSPSGQRRDCDDKFASSNLDSCHPHSILASKSKNNHSSSTSSSSSGVGSALCLSSLTSYPGVPSSPVDSLDSDLEHHLSLGRTSSPEQSCSSPSDSNQTVIPRLPTFARFANNSSLESE